MKYIITMSEHSEYEVEAPSSQEALVMLIRDLHTGSVDCGGATEHRGAVGLTYAVRSAP